MLCFTGLWMTLWTCVCVCVLRYACTVCITWVHLCAVLHYLRSEGLPGPCQPAEETPYICEATARGAEQSESFSQGLPLPHTDTAETHKHTQTHSLKWFKIQMKQYPEEPLIFFLKINWQYFIALTRLVIISGPLKWAVCIKIEATVCVNQTLIFNGVAWKDHSCYHKLGVEFISLLPFPNTEAVTPAEFISVIKRERNSGVVPWCETKSIL